MERHLSRGDGRDGRRGQSGQQPSTVALLTLVGRYVDSRRGRRGQSIAVHRTRTSRAAYDRALEDVDVLVMPTTPRTTRPLPDRAAGPGASIRAAIEMSANTTPFDISHHPGHLRPLRNRRRPAGGSAGVRSAFDEATRLRVARTVEAF